MDDAVQMAERFGLGDVDQISFVVADVDEAVPRYERIFGHFDVIETSNPDITYRGRKSSVSLKLGFGHCGAMEIELVEVLSGDHPARAHLAENGESIHHVRFPVTDLDATQAAMESNGFVTTFAGASPGVRYAYLEGPAVLGGTSIELLQWVPAGDEETAR